MTAHRVTIAEVAREAGVSLQTVSRAINNKGEISEETRQRVLRVARRLGFRPSHIARGLVTRKTLTVALVVPDIANPFFAEIARGAEDAAHDAGYSLLLGNTIEDPQRETDVLYALEEKCVDGIILCSSRLAAAALADIASRLPALVLVNRHVPSEAVATVRVDDAAGAQSATRHLLVSGRRRIGFLAGPPAAHSGQERARGYRQAIEHLGMAVDPSFSVHCAPFMESGRTAMEALLAAHPDLDAVFCYNDLVAVGALQACTALRRQVPHEVAVIGCDDILLASLVTPPLSTLRVDKREIGSAALHLLLDRIDGCSDKCREVVLEPQLILRASAP